MIRFLVILFLLAVPAAAAPFHSRPGAPATLYLDFDGSPASVWEGESVPAVPAFKTPSAIPFILTKVADAFRPFNLDVTDAATEPEQRKAIVAVIGGTLTWNTAYNHQPLAGLSVKGSFPKDSDPRVWVASEYWGGDPTLVAWTIEHEAGHAFDLDHQATGIMQTGNVPASFTWTAGINAAGKFQDDVAVIAGPANGFGFAVPEPATAILLGVGVTLVAARRPLRRVTTCL